MKRKFIFAAVFATAWFFLSCSFDPVGEGLGKNGTLPDVDNLIIADWDNTDIVYYYTIPPAPDYVYAYGYSGYIRISWYSEKYATNYNIYRSTSQTGTYSYIGNVANTGYSLYYNDSSAVRGITYYYKVSAENEYGESELSKSDYAKIY